MVKRGIWAVFVVLVFLAISRVGSAAGAQYAKPEDLHGKPLLVMTGTVYDDIARAQFPKSKEPLI